MPIISNVIAGSSLFLNNDFVISDSLLCHGSCCAGNIVSNNRGLLIAWLR
jgi:hypothetical protein